MAPLLPFRNRFTCALTLLYGASMRARRSHWALSLSAHAFASRRAARTSGKRLSVQALQLITSPVILAPTAAARSASRRPRIVSGATLPRRCGKDAEMMQHPVFHR